MQIVIAAMGYFSLVAVLMLLLLLAGGTNAARLYPERSNNRTSFLSQAGLLQGLVDTNKSGSIVAYWAIHRIYAGASAPGYYGFSVTMDVYDFSLTSEQASTGFVQIFNGGDGAPNGRTSILIGWTVSPQIYGGDSRAHLTAVWTTAGSRDSGCINTNCPVGFQPEAGAAIKLGDFIEPVSQPKGTKQSITIKVLKDGASGDWLVHYGFNQAEPTLIGRYPRSLFSGGLAVRATHVHIGGVVLAPSTDLAPMGSGYLPSTGAAASFNNFQIIDQNGQASLVNIGSQGYLTQPNTYSVSAVTNGQFFFGGPFKSTA